MAHTIWDVLSMTIPAICAIIGFIVGALLRSGSGSGDGGGDKS